MKKYFMPNFTYTLFYSIKQGIFRSNNFKSHLISEYINFEKRRKVVCVFHYDSHSRGNATKRD